MVLGNNLEFQTRLTPVSLILGPGPVDPIAPAVLLAQVQNAAPYLFEDEGRRLLAADPTRRAYIAHLRNARASLGQLLEAPPLSHFAYFRLCLAAHWATVGSFVPTDVDHQLRSKVWQIAHSDGLPADEVGATVDAMVELVLEARNWDASPVSQQMVRSPISNAMIDGHQGEWFSVAVAAYAATRRRFPALAHTLREAIEFEMTREAKVFLEFRRARDGIGLLSASYLVAHNLGNFDRMMDGWGMSAGDPLYDFGYNVAHEDGGAAVRFSGAFSDARRLSKAVMASENHRHFSLRSPRCLRKSSDFLLPIAPFWDSWGSLLSKHPELSLEEIAEVIEALLGGWEKLKGAGGTSLTMAYPRAVAGILESISGGMAVLAPLLTAHSERNLRSGLFRSLTAVSQKRFEDQWAQMALNFTK